MWGGTHLHHELLGQVLLLGLEPHALLPEALVLGFYFSHFILPLHSGVSLIRGQGQCRRAGLLCSKLLSHRSCDRARTWIMAMALTVGSIPAAFAAACASPAGCDPGGGKFGAGGSDLFDSLQGRATRVSQQRGGIEISTNKSNNSDALLRKGA